MWAGQSHLLSRRHLPEASRRSWLAATTWAISGHLFTAFLESSQHWATATALSLRWSHPSTDGCDEGSRDLSGFLHPWGAPCLACAGLLLQLMPRESMLSLSDRPRAPETGPTCFRSPLSPPPAPGYLGSSRLPLTPPDRTR